MTEDRKPISAEIPHKTVEVSGVNRTTRQVRLEDGTILPIATMLDEEGDETSDIAEAAVAVAGTDEFGWVVVTLDEFVERETGGDEGGLH